MADLTPLLVLPLTVTRPRGPVFTRCPDFAVLTRGRNSASEDGERHDSDDDRFEARR